MRGHEPLIALRRKGRKPDLVSVYIDPNPWDDWRTWPEWTDVPQIEVQPADNINRLDLRWAIDLNVMVAGCDADRVRSLFAAICQAGASRVLAFVQRVNEKDAIESVEALDSLELVHG